MIHDLRYPLIRKSADLVFWYICTLNIQCTYYLLKITKNEWWLGTIEIFLAWEGLLKFHVERSYQFRKAESESKNWEDWTMRSGKANSTQFETKLAILEHSFILLLYLTIATLILANEHVSNFQSQFKWLILEMNCQIIVAIIM